MYWISIAYMIMDLNGIFLISVLFFPDYLRLLVLRWLPCYSPVYFHTTYLVLWSIFTFFVTVPCVMLVYNAGSTDQ